MNTTVKPVNVVTIGMRTGGTSTDGNSNASYYIQLSTDDAGGGGYNDSGTVHTTNSTVASKYTQNFDSFAEYDSGSLAWNVVAGTTYYYGIKGMSSGRLVFGRGGTGSIYVNGTASTTWANDSLSGQILWDTVPNAPTITSASISTSGQLSIGWSVGTDDGMTETTAAWDDSSGAHITGYNIVYKATTDSAWKVCTADLYSWTDTGGGARLASGLTPANGYFIPGQTYEFRIAGLNGTTNAVQTDYSAITAQTGVRSASFTAKMPGGIYNGSTWVPFSNIKVYNGSSFVAPTTFKVYNGSTWKSLI
jgi:hypothetical protein